MQEEIGLLTIKDVSDIKESIIFNNWFSTFQKSNLLINKIIFRGIVRNNHGNIKCALIELNITDQNSITFNRNILLRGESVVIIPYYKYSNSSYKFILVSQPRIVNGLNSLEFPAGGVEPNISIADNAVKELREETGLLISHSRLNLLTSKISACESAFDELVTWYSVELSSEEFHLLQSKIDSTLGNEESGEFTNIIICTHADLEKVKSFQILAGIELLKRNFIL